MAQTLSTRQPTSADASTSETALRAEGFVPRRPTGLWDRLTPDAQRAALADNRVVASGDQGLPKTPR